MRVWAPSHSLGHSRPPNESAGLQNRGKQFAIATFFAALMRWRHQAADFPRIHQRPHRTIVFSSSCATYDIPDVLPIAEDPTAVEQFQVDGRQLLKNIAAAHNLRALLRYLKPAAQILTDAGLAKTLHVVHDFGSIVAKEILPTLHNLLGRECACDRRMG